MSTAHKRIEGLSPEKLALLQRKLRRQQRVDGSRSLTLRKRGDPSRFPLSFAQQRLWFLSQLERNSGFYNIAAAVRLKGSVDSSILERSLTAIMDRHEVLRARFVTRNGDPVQEIRPPDAFRIPVVDLSAMPKEVRTEQLFAMARNDVARPFDLANDILVRAILFKEETDRHILLLVLHHIVADGWSMGILVRELVTLYQAFTSGHPSPLPDLSLQYADYASWQQEWLAGEESNRQLAEWTARLRGMPQVLELPLDRQRPAVQTFNGNQVRFRVPQHVVVGMRSLAAEESATLFMGFLAAFELFLHRVTEQEDFGVGIPVAQRNITQAEELIGFFVNTLVMRASLQGDPSYREMMRRVRDGAVAAYDNQDVPFEKVVDALIPRRDISQTPLFQVMFDLQRSPLASVKLPGLSVEPLELEIRTSKTDLLLMLEEEGGSIAGYFEYNSDLFTPASINGLVEVFGTLLEDLVRRPDLPVSALTVLPERQREHLLVTWNATATSTPPKTLAALFEEQVGRTPEAVALEFDGVEHTYGEVNRKSNRIAWLLRGMGVGPDVPVGVFTDRSADMIIAILGIAKSGGAYLPMDVDYPRERLSFMVEDADVPLILTQERLRDRLPVTKAQIVCVDGELPVPARGDDANPEHAATLEHLAYVMYTSGSTGIPKGVSIPQKAVVRLVFNTNYVEILPTDRIAQASTASFDAATFEIWGALLHGARLVGIPKDVALSATKIASLIRDGKINTMFVTTALFNHMASEIPAAYSGMRNLMFGGEAADPRAVRTILASGAPERLVNAYGPTECTTFAAWYLVRSVEAGAKTIPIGSPLSNTTLYVLDQHFHPVPIGVVGELFIGGDGLARDYLKRPDLTAEKFLPDPFATRPGQRLYRTGDRVRMLPDGAIEFIGRSDFQVKIRGFRIEPGEVESVIAGNPEVREVSVVVRDDVPGEKRLVAYVVPATQGSLTVESLRSYLTEKLPQYMIPSAVVLLDELPLNSNGKVDKSRLPAPDETQLRAGGRFVPPSTPLEEFLAERWKEILGLDTISIHDNFFTLGGDSLKGAVLMNRLQKEFGETAHVSAIFLAPTIAELAMYMNVYFPEVIKSHFGVESSYVEKHKETIVTQTSDTRISVDDFTHFRRLIPALQPRSGDGNREQKNPRAIFVLSPPRSGSTLFRVMLAGHPRLFAPPELELLSFNTLRERKAALSATYSLWLDATVRALMEVEGCDADRARAIMEECEQRGQTIKEFYGYLQGRLGERLLVDKTPSYPLDMAILRRAEEDFEEPLFIHLTRHPYAMVYSFIEAKLDQNFFRHEHPFSRREIAELIWTVSHQNIMEFLKGIPVQRKYRLTFEDVLQEPVAAMKGLCGFLGIDYDPRLVEPYKGERMTDGVHARSQMVGDFKFYLRKSIDRRSVDRWRKFHSGDFLSEGSWVVAEALGYGRSAAGEGEAAGQPAVRAREELTAIPRIPREGVLPLSSAQLRLWFLEQLEPGSPLYNIPAAVRLQGNLDHRGIERALAAIVRRHESLRTTFSAVEGKPVQTIAAECAVALPVTHVAATPEMPAEQVAMTLVNNEAKIPFELARGPLFRARLLKLAEDDHILVLTMHHIVSDGWSVGVFIRELVDLYLSYSRGTHSRLPDLHVQYADFAAWQQQWLQDDVLARQLDYWKGQLAGATTVLELPTDRPRPAVQTANGSREPFRIAPEELEAVRELGSGEGATPFMALLGVFLALLHRYTGQEDICVGTPVANRTRTEIEPLIGFFVNTLVLRNDLAGRPTFRTLLNRVRQVCQGAFDHQEAPFEKVVDAIHPGRDLSRSALFQVMFSYTRSGISEVQIPGLSIRGMDVESGTSKFELTLEVTETTSGLRCVIEYNTDLFDRSTITRMIGHFRRLLKEVGTYPDIPVSDVPVLQKHEEETLLRGWNTERSEFPERETFHELFEAQVARTPEVPAVEYEGEVLSYSELNRRSNQLARYLRYRGVGAESLVGVCMERSVELIVGILGIFKAGGAYVALDPSYPRERLELIIGDAELKVVLTQKRVAEAVPTGPEAVIALDEDWARISTEAEENLDGEVGGENLAYLIYTSGSTGRPKGVMIRHRSVVNLWMGLVKRVYGNHGGGALRTSLNAPLLFDASVQELVTLLSGHCLCIVPQEIRGDGSALVSFIRRTRLDVVDCVPSQLKLMLASGLMEEHAEWVPRVLLPGGEAIDDKTWEVLSASTRSDAYNMYGPTECTVDSTICRCRELPGQASIGRPIVNVQHYVLDEYLQAVPVGVAGELYIGGEGLARGYYDRPELTAERFIPDPFGTEPGGRLYRTGDRVRYLADGNLVFMERVDNQVKVRGFRIELGEIEAVLEEHPRICQAVVVARGESSGEKRLAAYYVMGDTGELTVGELREHLKAKLPDYMVPSFFVGLEKMPLTPNGKADRRALPAPEAVRVERGTEVVRPRTPAEEVLAGIWKDVLRVSDLGVRDNFFELGGDSILSIQVIARANQAGLRLSPKHLFQNPTIEGLASVAEVDHHVEAEQGIVTGPVPLTPIQRWFFEQEFAEPDHWNQSVLIEVQERLDGEVLRRAVAGLLEHHDALRSRFRKTEQGWEQWVAAPDGIIPLETIDLSGVAASEQEGMLESHSRMLQASLNLSEGPLLRVGYFDLGDRTLPQLLIVVHHLAVDGVSWRIMVEDLQALYRQAAMGDGIRLPAKTTSFKAWAEKLSVYGGTDAIAAESDFWKSVVSHEPEPIPVDAIGGENTEASGAVESGSLDEHETLGLLQEVPPVYGTQITEVLLTALAKAFGRWTGRRVLHVDLEGHGREDLFDDVDLTRTVGWFTTLYPQVIDLRGQTTPSAELVAVKEQMRRIPRNGIGYGIARHLSSGRERLGGPPRGSGADIVVNYLGQFDQAVTGTSAFRVLSGSSGPERSPRAHRAHLLGISARVLGQKLVVDCAYSKNIHTPATVAKILHDFLDELRALIAHCRTATGGTYTPSDFKDAALSKEELNDLLEELQEESGDSHGA